MKTTMRGLALVVLAVAGGIALLAGNAQGADDAMPPEVQALIGMEIPDTESGMNGAVPEWKMKGGSLLENFLYPEQPLLIEELYQNKLSVFVIERLDRKKKSRTILDVAVLPRHMLNYNVKNGEIVWKKSLQVYRFERGCERERYETVVGVMRPERGKEDCTHKSKQVKRAWKIDHQTGRITEIPSYGVSCYFMDSEYACD